jgi:hypothetical protein
MCCIAGGVAVVVGVVGVGVVVGGVVVVVVVVLVVVVVAVVVVVVLVLRFVFIVHCFDRLGNSREMFDVLCVYPAFLGQHAISRSIRFVHALSTRSLRPSTTFFGGIPSGFFKSVFV